MRIYLAASYSRRREMLLYADQLMALGHAITSSWIDGHHEANSRHSGQADRLADVAERALWAQEDVIDILSSDTLIGFTEGPDAPGRRRGGRHVEFGIALGVYLAQRGAMAWRLMIVGPRENVFHCLPCVEWYDTWEACLAKLETERERG